jgi:hypothetical protein
MNLKERFAQMSKEDHREEAARLAKHIVKQVCLNLVIGAATTLVFTGITAGVNALSSSKDEIPALEE